MMISRTLSSLKSGSAEIALKSTCPNNSFFDTAIPFIAEPYPLAQDFTTIPCPQNGSKRALWSKIGTVYGIRSYCFEDFKVVAEDEAVYRSSAAYAERNEGADTG
jgi:hypothetical protein